MTKGVASIEFIPDPDGYYGNEVKPITITDKKMILILCL